MTAARKLEKRGERLGVQKGMQKGIQKGIQDEKLVIAKNMLRKGYAIESIQEITELSKESIEKIKQGI